MTRKELVVEGMTSEELTAFIQKEIAKGFEILIDKLVPPAKEFLTIDEYAEKLGVSRQTVWRWRKTGDVEEIENHGIKRIVNKPPKCFSKKFN